MTSSLGNSQSPPKFYEFSREDGERRFFLSDTQRAQAALVTVLPTPPSPPPGYGGSYRGQQAVSPSTPHTPASSSSSPTSWSPPTTIAPTVLKIVLPSSQASSSPQIRRIPLSPNITLPQLMASVMSVCQLSDPFLLRWDGAAGESVLLKRDEQLRGVMAEFGRSSGGSGVFKLHVVHKVRRTSRSSTDSLPATTSPLAMPLTGTSAMSASVPSLDESSSQRSTQPSQRQPTSVSLGFDFAAAQSKTDELVKRSKRLLGEASNSATPDGISGASTYKSQSQQPTRPSITSASMEQKQYVEEEEKEAMTAVRADPCTDLFWAEADYSNNVAFVATTDKAAASPTACCTCSPILSQINSQLTQLSTQVAAVHAAPVAAPTATCYSETVLLTLTAMVESLTARVESLSAQLQESERKREEAKKRNEERRLEREARQTERKADKEQNRRERERVREEERMQRQAERKAEREVNKQKRMEERKEQETQRRQRRDDERREKERMEQQRIEAEQQLQQEQQAVEGQHAEGEVETDDMSAAVDSRPATPTLSAASAHSFASSTPSSRHGLDIDSPSLSEEELDVLAPLLESTLLSPSSSAYLLCPPAPTASSSISSAASGSSASSVVSRLDDMLDRLETEGYGVRSLNALVVSEHGGEDADWDVVRRDLNLYYAQG